MRDSTKADDYVEMWWRAYRYEISQGTPAPVARAVARIAATVATETPPLLGNTA